jgi:hypothetical protein
MSDNANFLAFDAKGSASLARTTAVRADHRLRADEERIRTQSAILCEYNPRAAVAFINNRVFRAERAMPDERQRIFSFVRREGECLACADGSRLRAINAP